ncbi:MAG: type II toxin-antitoxin system RelE/ParE family toxin [Thermodesulfobacteriota bacterium]|nr:type II toxin-antitoxin system RelE/ParE family toxin [Thermodesulfobacteriota bacterium]
MKVAFRKSFERDLRRIKDRSTLDRVKLVVEQVEEVSNLAEIRNVKKLTGTVGFFRIRIGQHRIGISLDADEVE